MASEFVPNSSGLYSDASEMGVSMRMSMLVQQEEERMRIESDTSRAAIVLSSQLDKVSGLQIIKCIKHIGDRGARIVSVMHEEPLMYGTSVQFMQRMVNDGVMLHIHNVISNKVNKPISYIIKLLSYCQEIDRSLIYEYDRQEFKRGGYLRLGGYGAHITVSEKSDERVELLCEPELRLEAIDKRRTFNRMENLKHMYMNIEDIWVARVKNFQTTQECLLVALDLFSLKYYTIPRIFQRVTKISKGTVHDVAFCSGLFTTAWLNGAPIGAKSYEPRPFAYFFVNKSGSAPVMVEMFPPGSEIMNLQPKYSANVVATSGSLAGVINTISDKYHVSVMDIWMDRGLRVRVTGMRAGMTAEDVEVEQEALKRMRNIKIDAKVKELYGEVQRGKRNCRGRRGRGRGGRDGRGRGGSSSEDSTTSGVYSDSSTQRHGLKNRKSH